VRYWSFMFTAAKESISNRVLCSSIGSLLCDQRRVMASRVESSVESGLMFKNLNEPVSGGENTPT